VRGGKQADEEALAEGYKEWLWGKGTYDEIDDLDDWWPLEKGKSTSICTLPVKALECPLCKMPIQLL